MRRILSVVALFLATLPFAFSQTLAASHSDALDLLTRVVQRYSNAKSYDIESMEEQMFNREFSRQWSKSILISAQELGNRSHFEGHNGEGNSMQVSDGKTMDRLWDAQGYSGRQGGCYLSVSSKMEKSGFRTNLNRPTFAGIVQSRCRPKIGRPTSPIPPCRLMVRR